MSPAVRFHFPLETVLRVRELREEQARLELARALARLEKSRQVLQDMERQLVEKLGTLHRTAAEEMEAPDYQLHADYLDHLQEAIQTWQARLAQEEREVEELKLKLEQLYQERRLLARLKEKQYAHFRREVEKVLEKEAEAGVLQRWPGRQDSGAA
ncbi:MAG: flagellar export protein FliJ [Deltaproteobacteria bacterium]|nr:flagellar export protein FliJ [Deltaproteobacteria bacterium]